MNAPMGPGIIAEFTIGDRLRKAREIAGLSQAQLAVELGLARRTVIKYESDALPAKRSNLMAWALRTGVAYEWILEGPSHVAPDAQFAWISGEFRAGEARSRGR